MTTPFARAALPALLVLMCCLAPGPAYSAGARPWHGPDNATDNATETATGQAGRSVPDDAAALAQYEVLRQYFERQATLDDRLPELFSRRVRREEALAFLTMRETVNRRGQLERFRMAKVDVSGLKFRRVTGDPDLARIHVTGSYTVGVPPVLETIEEDALFVLLPEMGQWRIFERREGWR